LGYASDEVRDALNAIGNDADPETSVEDLLREALKMLAVAR
jgi:Holliday junction resolvasome RuvABC DNA-binding subunit